VLRLAESFVPIRDVNYFDAREQTRWKNDQPFHLLLFLSDDDRNAITLAIRQLQVYNASNKLIVEFLSAIHQDSFTYRQLLILKPLLIPKLFEKIHDVIAERYRIGRRAWQWGVVIQMQDGTFKAFAGLRHSRRELICKLLEQGGMVVQAHLWQDTPEGRKEIIDTKIDRANDPKLSTIDFRTLFGGGHDLRVFGDRVNDVSRKRRGSSESNSAAKREEHPPHSVQP